MRWGSKIYWFFSVMCFFRTLYWEYWICFISYCIVSSTKYLKSLVYCALCRNLGNNFSFQWGLLNKISPLQEKLDFYFKLYSSTQSSITSVKMWYSDATVLQWFSGKSAEYSKYPFIAATTSSSVKKCFTATNLLRSWNRSWFEGAKTRYITNSYYRFQICQSTFVGWNIVLKQDIIHY